MYWAYTPNLAHVLNVVSGELSASERALLRTAKELIKMKPVNPSFF